MITAHQAHLWGIKAAQAGLSFRSNPYLNSQARSAWEAGYQQASLGGPALDRG